MACERMHNAVKPKLKGPLSTVRLNSRQESCSCFSLFVDENNEKYSSIPDSGLLAPGPDYGPIQREKMLFRFSDPSDTSSDPVRSAAQVDPNARPGSQDVPIRPVPIVTVTSPVST